MPIVWKANKMSTGTPALDAGHREWIRCLNELERTILSGSEIQRIQKMFDFMVECAELNFAHEELLTNGLETPAARINGIKHDNFRDMARAMRKRLEDQNTSWMEIVSLEIGLEKWLVRHLCEVDAHLWHTIAEESPIFYGVMV